MKAAKPRIPYTYDDYRTLPEDMSRRYELLDGDLYRVPAPTTTHQRVLRKLLGLLDRHINAMDLGEVFCAPVDVILGEGNAREVAQPDIVFVAKAGSDIVKLHGIEGAPDLVIEILSPGTQERDRGYKRTLYARYGVREYWIFDPEKRTLEVYAAKTEGPSLSARHTEDSVLSSSIFPGLKISLRDVFAN
jgi:Uma2 family endonuclease